MIRLQKYMAASGVASRRKCEVYIAQSKVTVNGQTITEPGYKIDEMKDEVRFMGKLIQQETQKVYLMLNKPKGYITTVKDQFDRPSVLDLVLGYTQRLVPVGRLDYDSSGLLLLTNDGDFVYRMTHPKHQIEKEYLVKVKGTPSKQDLDKLRKGVMLDGYQTKSAQVVVKKQTAGFTKLSVTIHEGRNRQVRRMFDLIGTPVVTLKRIRVGEVSIGELKPGAYRELTENEVFVLNRHLEQDGGIHPNA